MLAMDSCKIYVIHSVQVLQVIYQAVFLVYGNRVYNRTPFFMCHTTRWFFPSSYSLKLMLTSLVSNVIAWNFHILSCCMYIPLILWGGYSICMSYAVDIRDSFPEVKWIEHQVDHSLSSNAVVKPLSTDILSGTLSATLPKQPYHASKTFWSLSLGCANTAISHHLIAAITCAVISL